MEDIIIRLTQKDDNISAAEMEEQLRIWVEDNLLGWSILQLGPQSSMTESLYQERKFVRTLLQEFPDE